MTDIAQSLLWIWPEPDKRWASNVMDHVKSIEIEKELVILHCSSISVIDESISLVKYVLGLCHKFELLENGKTTFLNYKDHLLALELCLVRYKHEKGEKESKIQDNEIIDSHEIYSTQCHNAENENILESSDNAVQMYKKFLRHSNCIDLWCLFSLLKESISANKNDLHDFLSNCRFLVFGAPESEILKLIIQQLALNRNVHHIIVETPLDVSLQGSPTSSPTSNTFSKVANVFSEFERVEDIALSSDYAWNPVSATKEYAEDIILAFLNLLVNSRNELALSKAMTSPIIDLSHSAFTDLKHISLQKQMPMCQTVISYVTRLSLGGKGYAPPKDCPLLSHLKGLKQFVDILNQLQTIIEEDTNTKSAVKRVINTVKNKLLKFSGDKLRNSSVEDAAKYLVETTVKLTEEVNEIEKLEKVEIQVGQESLDVLHNLVNYVACCYCSYDSKAILEERNLHKTPLNVPPLLGYFRSPEENTCSNDNSLSSLRENEKHKSDSCMDTAPPVSYFHSSESNSVSKSCFGMGTPTKTNFKDCLTDQENSGVMKSVLSGDGKAKKPLFSLKTGKRSILSDISNERAPKKANKKTSKKETTSKRSKVKPQIIGQGQITKFFLLGK